MIDFLLPSTDAGVVLQLVVWMALTGLALMATRSRPDARLLVIGISAAGFGLMAVRAVH